MKELFNILPFNRYDYYVSQFIAFLMLFIVASVVFLNNRKKNIKISEQLNALKTLANDLETTNTLLKEEIEEHQKTIFMLHDSEQRFKSIVYALPDVVFKLDNQGTFLECESRDTSWLLVPKAEFINKRIFDILPPNIAALSLEKIEMTLKTDQVQILEYKLDEEGKDAFYEVRFIKSNDSEIYAILRNITEAKQRQQMVEYLSFHDQLTGLYNRRFFEEELKRLDTARNLPITLVMLDVNGLKLTNDAFGHLVGDQLLILVADILKRICRSDDIVARIGGDEFVMLLPKTSIESAERIANRIYSAVADTKLNQIDISVSIGWAAKLTSDQPIKELFIKAEELMYRKKLTESQSMRNNTIQVILKTLNEKNKREKVHSEKVSKLSKRIGEMLDLNHETLKEIEIAALMHDIGKIAVAECVLNKPGQLTEEEYQEIKRHPESGYQILKSADAYLSLAEYVLCHHEKWNGTGYPRGLKGEEIPLISRIIAIADAYEAMTSNRTYRKAISSEEALHEIERYSGIQFDPSLVKKLRKTNLNLNTSNSIEITF